MARAENRNRGLRMRELVFKPSRLYFVFSFLLAGLWILYLIHHKASVPTRDDLNFFLPLLVGSDPGLSWADVLSPQGPHFHISYKLMTQLLYDWTGYNVLVFSVFGPLSVVLLCWVLFRYLKAETSVFDPIPLTADTFKSGRVWLVLCAVLLIPVLVFTPLKSIDFVYDMLTLNGMLSITSLILMLYVCSKYLHGRGGLAWVFIVGLIAVWWFGVATFKPFFLALVAAAVLAGMPFPGATGYFRIDLKRLALLVGFFACLWISYDVMLEVFDAHLGEPSEFSFVNMLGWLEGGLFQSLGGRVWFDRLGLPVEFGASRLALFVWIVAGCVLILPFLISGRHIFLLAMLGQPLISAVSAGIVRGGVEMPRYQGLFGLFWVGVGLVAVVAFADWMRSREARPASRKGWDTSFRIAAKDGSVLLLIPAISSMVSYSGYLSDHSVYVRRHFARQEVIFYSHPELSDRDVQVLNCRQGVEVCQELVDAVRAKRGVVLPR
ncbi:hypothetical protein [Maricaulis sp. CAU 1757]